MPKVLLTEPTETTRMSYATCKVGIRAIYNDLYEMWGEPLIRSAGGLTVKVTVPALHSISQQQQRQDLEGVTVEARMLLEARRYYALFRIKVGCRGLIVLALHSVNQWSSQVRQRPTPSSTQYHGSLAQLLP